MNAESERDAYFVDAIAFSRMAYSHWQREPASPSFGCFDRQYWGWKKKDMADAALQAAVTLVVRFAEHEGATATLPELLNGYVGFLERIQHADGSFDQIYPHEKAPSVVYDVLSSLLSVWRSQHLDAKARSRLEAVMRRGVDYALSADERHGEIANHFAHYAWELFNYGREFDNFEALLAGERYLERTLRLFHPEEGWFTEYDGADAGYQTRCLTFLSKIAELTQDRYLWDVLHKAASFIDGLLMPDGSIHPMLGVRSTALMYVSGFERVAGKFPKLAALADRVHEGWRSGASLKATSLDFENGLRVADDAFDASALRCERISMDAATSAPAAQKSDEIRSVDLNSAGLHKRTIQHDASRRILFVGSRLGGAVVLYEAGPGMRPQLIFEDAGYMLESSNGVKWVMRYPDSGKPEVVSEREISVTATFIQSLHEDMSPVQLVVLRLLNLTVLRSQWIGDLFRKLVVRRLISGRRAFSLTCNRRILINQTSLVVRDRFYVAPELASKVKGLRLFRCRRITANHMASSRYFQPQEILCAQPWIEAMQINDLDGSEVEKVIIF